MQSYILFGRKGYIRKAKAKDVNFLSENIFYIIYDLMCITSEKTFLVDPY